MNIHLPDILGVNKNDAGVLTNRTISYRTIGIPNLTRSKSQKSDVRDDKVCIAKVPLNFLASFGKSVGL